jgi:cyanide hydratase
MAAHVYAIEGGSFVLFVSHTKGEKRLKSNGLSMESEPTDSTSHVSAIGCSFSQIIAPEGRSLTGPVDPTFEGLIYADLEFNEMDYAKNIVDPLGQCSRTDMFILHVDNEVKHHCVYKSDEEQDYNHASRFRDVDLKDAGRKGKAPNY